MVLINKPLQIESTNTIPGPHEWHYCIMTVSFTIINSFAFIHVTTIPSFVSFRTFTSICSKSVFTGCNITTIGCFFGALINIFKQWLLECYLLIMFFYTFTRVSYKFETSHARAGIIAKCIDTIWIHYWTWWCTIFAFINIYIIINTQLIIKLHTKAIRPTFIITFLASIKNCQPYWYMFDWCCATMIQLHIHWNLIIRCMGIIIMW